MSRSLTVPVVVFGPRPSVGGQDRDKVQLCERHLAQYQGAYLACHGRITILGDPVPEPCTACAVERLRR